MKTDWDLKRKMRGKSAEGGKNRLSEEGTVEGTAGAATWESNFQFTCARTRLGACLLSGLVKLGREKEKDARAFILIKE